MPEQERRRTRAEVEQIDNSLERLRQHCVDTYDSKYVTMMLSGKTPEDVQTLCDSFASLLKAVKLMTTRNAELTNVLSERDSRLAVLEVRLGQQAEQLSSWGIDAHELGPNTAAVA